MFIEVDAKLENPLLYSGIDLIDTKAFLAIFGSLEVVQ